MKVHDQSSLHSKTLSQNTNDDGNGGDGGDGDDDYDDDKCWTEEYSLFGRVLV